MKSSALKDLLAGDDHEAEWDEMEDLKDWFSSYRTTVRRRRRSGFNFGSLGKKYKGPDYKELKAETEKLQAKAEKTLQNIKNEITKICEGVKLTSAQMEEEWKKFNAIKAYGAAQFKLEKHTKSMANRAEKIKRYAAKC